MKWNDDAEWELAAKPFESDDLVPCALNLEGRRNATFSTGTQRPERWLTVYVRHEDLDRFDRVVAKRV